MNLALSALLVLLLLLPAFSFRIGIAIPVFNKKKTPADTDDLQGQLTSRNVSKVLSKLNFTETIFLFSIIPILLHFISILVIRAFGYSVKFDLLLNIFSGQDDVLKNTSNAVFQTDLLNFLWYSLCEAVLGFVLGLALAWLLLGGQWMLRVLMGNNIWYKLFAGTSLPEEKRKKIVLILVEVLATTKETSVIYSGWLKNYEVVSNNPEELSYLTLSSAARRDLRAAQVVDKNPTATTESISSYKQDYGPIIQIPGNNFTVLGKEIINVNVTYMELQDDPLDPTKKIPVPIS